MRFKARSAAALLFNASGNEALFHSGIERMLVQGVSGLLIISRRTDRCHTTWIPSGTCGLRLWPVP